jgi:large subunit ribosomal protein L10
MNKEEKTLVIDDLVQKLTANKNFYLADTSALPAEKTSQLRRLCFNKKISMIVVKNTLLEKAMERTSDAQFKPLYGVLKGSTSILFCESGSEPAKMIKEFRKDGTRPVLKAAYVEESVYIGDNMLDTLASIRSKDEVIGEIITLLQSPAKNVISGLLSGKNKLAGIVKTLSERPEKNN